MASYRIVRTDALPELEGRWESPAWGRAPALVVGHFHPTSSDHRPRTEVKLVHSGDALHVLFRVDDRYVRSIHTDFESDTYKDSCVELFMQPEGRVGYFALEVNCGGAFSLRYIEDPRRTPNRFVKWTAVSADDAARVRIAHSMPAVVEPGTDRTGVVVDRSGVAVERDGAVLRADRTAFGAALARQPVQVRRRHVPSALGELGRRSATN